MAETATAVVEVQGSHGPLGVGAVAEMGDSVLEPLLRLAALAFPLVGNVVAGSMKNNAVEEGLSWVLPMEHSENCHP